MGKSEDLVNDTVVLMKGWDTPSPKIGDSWQNSKGETFLFTSAGWENMEIKI